MGSCAVGLQFVLRIENSNHVEVSRAFPFAWMPFRCQSPQEIVCYSIKRSELALKKGSDMTMSANEMPSLFTVYYMNQEKVFETRMLLDNRLKTAGSEESQSGTTKGASINAEAEFNPPVLAKLKARLKGDYRTEKQEKIVDTLEYVNTTSRMLADIMGHCKVLGTKVSLAEGDLAYIGDVSLKLINEDEIRGIMAIMSGTFDGITVPDAGNLDIGRMMQSFIGDGAAFKLEGNRSRKAAPLYAKIPFNGEEMFESCYTIDDLLIGKVGIVGICKGKITPDQMKSPLDYFQQPSDSKCTLHDDVVACGESPAPAPVPHVGERETKGYYIDILAVIQAVSFEG